MGTINRNALCPCGSGEKYKKCCMGSTTAPTSATVEKNQLEWGKQSRGRDQDNEIDRFIIQGYDLLDKQDHEGACQAWARVWDQFLLRLSPGMNSCEETLPIYDGSFIFSNWTQDYCAAIHGAAEKDAVWAQTGASFCTQILMQFTKENDTLLENFRASLGEFHFLAGEAGKGEKVLLELIADRPHRSVGYAYLAQMLGEAKYNVGGVEALDPVRAIALLEKGLAYPTEDAQEYDLERRLGWYKGAGES